MKDISFWFVCLPVLCWVISYFLLSENSHYLISIFYIVSGFMVLISWFIFFIWIV